MKTEVSGNAQEGGEEHAHADQRVGADGAGEVGKKCFSKEPTAAPSMAPMKRVGANMPPGVPLENERVVAMILKRASSSRILKANWPCMAWSMTLVAGAHDLGKAEVADASDEEPGERRAGASWTRREGGAGAGEGSRGLGEDEGGDAADDAEDGVGEELAGSTR
jgi:hypothetical protein